MGLYGKTKSGNNESWGLGLLLVLFLDDENNEDNNNQHNQKYNEQNKKKNLTTSPFKSSPSSNRSNTPSFFSSNKLLISKAQSTISICTLIVFFTLFLFTLSTFEPSFHSSTSTKFPRRWLPEKINYSLDKTHIKKSQISSSSVDNFALQGMGTLFRRGTKPMNDLIVAHLTEDITGSELQLFLRTLHRSSITAKSDAVFIYSSSLSPNFTSIIHQENESFSKLVHHHRTNLNDSPINVAKKLKTMIHSFDVTQFSKSDNKGESLWGKRIRMNSNHSNNNNSAEDEINESSIGSMVGFETAELDPEDSLSGFFNDPPSIRLRRWACYPMLLGRVRRNFKHIMLVNVKDVVILGDSLSRVRSRSAESVHLWMMNKNLDKTQFHNKKDQSKQPLTADLIMGGMRGIRRLSNAMLNEIVRATMKHKGKTNTISDSGILSQLIHNESLLKHIEVSVTTDSAIPDTSSLVNSKRNSSLNHHRYHHHQNIVHRGNRDLDLNSILLREMCSSSIDSLVYSDC